MNSDLKTLFSATRTFDTTYIISKYKVSTGQNFKVEVIKYESKQYANFLYFCLF